MDMEGALERRYICIQTDRATYDKACRHRYSAESDYFPSFWADIREVYLN